ncbi:MAG: hypothetical protein ACRENP_13980 [Longimicrobiales bacterium]
MMRIAVCTIGVLVAAGLPPQASGQLPPFVEFRVPKAPQVVAGDSGAAVVYEVHVTNLTANVLTLKRIEVVNEADQRVLYSVEDSALARAMARPGANVPLGERTRIGGGLRAVVFLWV